MKKNFNFFILILFFLNFPYKVYSEKYDIDISKLLDKNYKRDDAGFKKLAEELGVAFSPKVFGPAESLGAMVFDIGYEISFTNINEKETYWTKTTKNPEDFLTTMQIKIRKGLPYSLEVGGNISHLFQSPMWGVGIDIKWAIQEGFKYIPDFAIRTNVNTVLGEHDLAMLMTGFDIITSKTFGIFGLFSISPYAGYNMIYINASSHVFGIFKEGKAEPDQDVFPQQGIFKHRGIVGFRILATYISFGSEVALTEGLQTYSFKLGVLF